MLTSSPVEDRTLRSRFEVKYFIDPAIVPLLRKFIVGLGAGVRFVTQEGLANVRNKEERLTKLLLDGLSAIPDIICYGNGDPRERVAVVSFNILGVLPSEVALQLEEDFRIMCRPGLQCSPAAHRTLGTFPQGTVRLSPGHFNSGHDIERTLEAVRQIARKAR